METLGSVKKQTTQRVGFLLMDQFTLVSLSSAIDPLRVANSLSDSELYRWCLIGAGEGEQVSSDGVRVKLAPVPGRYDGVRVGELLVASPSLFSGYRGRPEATAAVLQ